jgi:hypothetical protein
MPISYWMLVVLLCVVTGGEWAVFLQRETLGIGVDWLMPSLLGLSFLKLAGAVWYFLHAQAQGWPKKALITFLTVAGGGTILLAMLL